MSNVRHLLTALSRGGQAPASIPSGPIDPDPDPDPDPTDPEDPGEPTDPSGDLMTMLLASCHAIWPHDDTGATVRDVKGDRDGSIVTGSVTRLQPSLILDDPHNSTRYNGNARTLVPHHASLPKASGGILVIAQPADPLAWQVLVARRQTFSDPGGLSIASIAGGVIRAQLHDGTGNIALDGPAAASVAGKAMGHVLTWGTGGLKLYHGNIDGAALVASNASTAGPVGELPWVFGANFDGSSPFSGAINVVALFDGQPSDALVLDILAEIKSGVVWTNDAAATVTAGQTVDLDVKARALTGAAPILEVTAQASPHATLSVHDGKLRVAAGGTAGSNSAGRFRFDGSAPAVLSLTVEEAETPPSGDEVDLFYAYSAASAMHIPIGSGANIGGANHPESLGFQNIQGLSVNYGAPNGRAAARATPEMTLREIKWASRGQPNGTDEGLPFKDAYPVTLRLPPARTGTNNAQEQINNWPVRYPSSWQPGVSFDGMHCLFDPVTRRWHDFRQFVWQTFLSTPHACQYYSNLATGLGHGTVVGGARVGSSASGVAAMFACLRGEHINTPGRRIPHAVSAVVASVGNNPHILSRDIILPATHRDAHASNPANNNGHSPYGRRMTFEHGINLDGLGLSEPGRRLAQAIFEFGLFLVDNGNSAFGGALRADQYVSSAVRSVLSGDMAKMKNHLRPCLHAWAPGQSICGGGTPRGPNYGWVAA